MNNPRKIALDALYRVIHQNGYANLILRRANDLSQADQALVSALVYGTLRNYLWLEYQWRGYAEKKVRPQTAVLLDMSVFQLLYLQKIPAYAVLSEAVELAAERDRKFVNAILRQVERNGVRPAPDGDPLKKAALETSHPEWLLRLWAAHYGEADALAIAAHDQTSAGVYGRINRLRISPQELQEHPEVTMLENDCFRYSGVLSRTPWFRDGQVIIQDRAAQLIPYFLDVKPGMNVLDLCAAPGTKTQQIAVLMENQGELTANDVNPGRVKLIEQLMEKTGVGICRTTVQDASVPVPEWQREGFDRVLADAPCSGLGDLRHKPEIRLHVTPESIDELVRLQQRILDCSADYVRPGGILVYSTCTLNRKENENQVRSFLQRHPGFVLNKEKTCLPQELDSDGFYMAQLTRNS
ncbi:MAG: 16S rRNA (cytosine(967)-C(5))-methyltransferase RsmB [Solobacterium sp.]|nr:16S rRNA (cytosine(967)-C(5))-methyltransferase RsmB [Solobacterium sp.]